MNEQSLPKYVLITPARNEEAFIEKTLESVIHQTHLPLKWVIINDGSTDSTANRVEPYLAKYDWIALVNLPVRRERNFAAKVNAFNKGQELMKGLDYEITGNLDSDVSLDPDHFEFLMNRFRDDPRLGVAGTVFREQGGYNSGTDSLEGQFYVSGQCQMFRRECFKEIGGYFANKAGGIDWIAVTTARMIGWNTRSFREKSFFHHRHLGTAERSAFAASFSYGEKDYYLGGHPVWELFRVAFRTFKAPHFEGLALGLGYGWAAVRRQKRPISKELMTFHRREQMRKLKAILKFAIAFKPSDKFELLSE